MQNEALVFHQSPRLNLSLKQEDLFPVVCRFNFQTDYPVSPLPVYCRRLEQPVITVPYDRPKDTNEIPNEMDANSSWGATGITIGLQLLLLCGIYTRVHRLLTSIEYIMY